MADCQEFCLRWNNFQSNITHQFETLRDDEDFVDVTLTCGGKCIKAHKVVLSACSPYFKELLKNNPCKHPIIFMRDVEFEHLKALVAFMYAGVVNVEQAQLATFLRTAEALHILGLTEAPQLHRDIKNFPSGSTRSASGTTATITTSPLPGNSTTTVSSGSKEEGEEGGRTSPSESAPSAKRAKTSNTSSTSGGDREPEAARGWTGGGSTGEAEESVSPGSIVPASALFQQSRGSLVITPADPADNDLDQSYNDDLADMLEPKTEIPDYSSDGESRTDAGSYLDNSGDVHGFGTMNDLMSATSSQGATGQDGQPTESYQEWEAFEVQELPGDIAPHFPRWRQRIETIIGNNSNRRRSNVTGERGPLGTMVNLGPGVDVPAAQLEALKWTDYRKLTRGLAGLVFTPLELATRSVTGQRWSRAASYGHGAATRHVKPALDSDKVNAILAYVRSAFPSVEPSRIKQVLAYKCQESSVALKMKAGIFGLGGPAQVHLLEMPQGDQPIIPLRPPVNKSQSASQAEGGRTQS